MRIAAAIVFLLFSTPAHSFSVTCDDVRSYVAQYGKAKAVAFAISHGATLAQIREARKCLAMTGPRAF
jgi:hypothetical protein